MTLATVCRSPAADLSTTNQDRINRFFSIVDQTNRPVTLLSFGDSMADSYRSITWSLATNMSQRLSVSGYSLDGGGKIHVLTGGATEVGASTFWFGTHLQIPVGGGVTWEWQSGVSGLGLKSDRVGIFWVAQPTGGNFTLDISTNGGLWSPLLTLNGYAASAIGKFTNVIVPPGYYRIGATSLSGTNILLGPWMLNTQTNGVHISYVSYGGISLSQVTNVSRAIREPVFHGLSPDLLIWHMKEDDTEATHQRLLECEDWWAAAIPNCDVIYIGTPYVAPESGGTNITIGQNQIVRSVAIAKQRAYMDCMTPGVSFLWLTNNGYMDDSVHLSRSGGQFFADLMWRDLNFFAMRLDRHLKLQSVSTNLQLFWTESRGAIYDLQASTNLIGWSNIHTEPGSNLVVTQKVNLMPGNNYYRLRLQAN